ncbi:MAG: hypothetical protein ABIN95_06180 [Mucilaginibacter sp.]
MKKITCLLAVVAIMGCSQAKNNGNTENVITSGADSAAQKSQSQQNIQNIPPFRILTTDSVYVTQTILKKNKPVMFIYFSPDCTHCTKFLDELKPHLKELSKFQIVMVTWIKYAAVKPFYDKMGYSAYKNITMGTEGDDLLVQQYFQIKDTPYVAIYNQSGKLVKTFDKPEKVDELLATAKKA